MKKLMIAAALAFAVFGGTAAMLTLAATPAAYADGNGNGH